MFRIALVTLLGATPVFAGDPFAAAKARQERFPDVRITWHAKHQFFDRQKPDATPSVVETKSTLLMRPDRLRLDTQTPTSNILPGRYVAVPSIHVQTPAGVTASWPDGMRPGTTPNLVQSGRPSERVLSGTVESLIALHFRGADDAIAVVKLSDFVRSQEPPQDFEGRRCVAYDRRGSDGDYLERLWFDEQSAVLRKRETFRKTEKLSEATVEYDSEADPTPCRWHVRLFRSGRADVDILAERTAFTATAGTPDSVFELAIPAGTLVNDADSHAYSVVQADGSRLPWVPTLMPGSTPRGFVWSHLYTAALVTVLMLAASLVVLRQRRRPLLAAV